MRIDRNGYHQLPDPARFLLNYKKDQILLACCDCGLTHHISFRVKGDKLFIRMSRNEKETRLARKKHR